MGAIVEFWSVPADSPVTALGATPSTEEIQQIGRLVGDCTVNSLAVEEVFGALHQTPLSPLLPQLSKEIAAVVLPAEILEELLDKMRLSPPRDVVQQALEDALEEVLWRGEALAVAVV